MERDRQRRSLPGAIAPPGNDSSGHRHGDTAAQARRTSTVEVGIASMGQGSYLEIVIAVPLLSPSGSWLSTAL
jgi:hypothetical protein